MKKFSNTLIWVSQLWTLFCVGTGIGFLSSGCSTRPHGEDEISDGLSSLQKNKGDSATSKTALATPGPTSTPEATSTPDTTSSVGTSNEPVAPPEGGVLPPPGEPTADNSSVTAPGPALPAGDLGPEETYFKGLTSTQDPNGGRLLTADEASAKAAELSNAGIDLQVFTSTYSFLTSLHDADQQNPALQKPFQDHVAVDKAMELVKGGFNLEKLKSTTEFLADLRDANAQRLKPVAMSLEQAKQLVQAPDFDLERLRTEYSDAINQDPSSSADALQRSLDKLGYRTN